MLATLSLVLSLITFALFASADRKCLASILPTFQTLAEGSGESTAVTRPWSENLNSKNDEATVLVHRLISRRRCRLRSGRKQF